MTGQNISHYRILEKLGRGGMGVVYKAEDLKLKRTVALKFLPEELSRGPHTLERFQREARAASALNHPHICTIYDIDEAEGRHFIAMEYVEGETLGAVLARGPLPVGDAVRHAIQIAHALSAAHRAHIIHRDIKPGNIMITRSDTVKVLDFGLAKHIGTADHRLESSKETVTVPCQQTPLTEKGRVPGTVSYMSPEQVEGLALDARSDIFSFGAVLYEALTGKRAFQGTSTASTLAKILRDDVPRFDEVAPKVPRDVEEVVRLCLRKQVDERAESMHDVACMLEQVARLSDAPRAAAEPVNRRGGRRWIAAALMAFALAVAGGVGSILWRSSRPAGPRPDLQRVTWDGELNLHPTLSADGRLLAFASDRAGEGGLDIFVRHVSGGEPIRLTNDPGDDVDPSISPDGSQIAFRSTRRDGGVYTVPTLGGHERLIAAEGANPRYSPNGKWIAYWVGDAAIPMPSGRMYIVPATGGSPVKLQPSLAGRFPVWTPDGAHILFEGMQTEGTNIAPPDWWVAPQAGGPAVKTGALELVRRAGLTAYEPGGWLENKLVFSAREGNTRSLFKIPISLRTWRADGPPEPVTFGTGTDGQPQTSRDGQIVFTSLHYEVNAWSRRMDGHGRIMDDTDHRITTGAAYHSSLSLSSDGSLMVFLFGRHPRANVGSRNLRSSREIAVTLDPADKCSAAIRGDGTRVAWSVCGPGPESILTADLLPGPSAGPPERVCEDCGRVTEWSPSGDRIVFVDHAAPTRIGMLTVGMARHSVIASSRYALDSPRFSPDGKWLAFTYKLADRARICAMPVADGTPVPESEWVPITDGQSWDEMPVWTADGDALLFFSRRDGFGCVWRQAVDPLTRRVQGSPTPAIHFHRRRFSMKELGASLVSLAGTRQMFVYTLLESSASIWTLDPSRRDGKR